METIHVHGLKKTRHISSAMQVIIPTTENLSKRQLKNRQNKGLNGKCKLNEGRTCIKRYLVLKPTFGVLFEWPLKTGFTVNARC